MNHFQSLFEQLKNDFNQSFRGKVEEKEASKVLKEAQDGHLAGKWYPLTF